MISGLGSRICAAFSSRFLCLGVGLVFSGAVATAHAAGILDGGFETAGAGGVFYAGQSIDSGSWNVTTGAVYIDSADPYVYAGANSLNLTYANLYAPNTVSQALSTVVGQSYTVSFWGNADTANTFALRENGLAVSGLPASIANNGFPGTTNSALFVNYSGTFLAGAANTTLSFTATGDPGIGSENGSVMIDDVSLQPASAVTPEPGSLALVATGLLGLGAAMRQRRSLRQGA